MLLSVIIPTRDRCDYLAGLLDSLRIQGESELSWEVIVVDNGSTDATREIVERRSESFPVSLRRVYEPEPGLHCARNCGVQEATGEIVAFLDDDMAVASGWIRGASLIVDGEAQAVTGRTRPRWLVDPPDWATQVWDGSTSSYWNLLDLGDEVTQLPIEHAAGGNCFVLRSIVLELGGFNPDLLPPELVRFRGDGQSGFYRRFAEAGYRLCYDPVAAAEHLIGPDKVTLEYLCERAFNLGISDSYREIRRAGGNSADFWALLNDQYQKGKIFHREQVRSDPDLLDWVLRESYLRCRA